jgi:hypothetical protein
VQDAQQAYDSAKQGDSLKQLWGGN